MSDLFARALLAHLTGDYLLQSKKMAIQKHKSIKWCGIHVTIYTVATCVWLWTINPLVFAAVFVPHFIIDYYSLGIYWLKLIKGRTFEDATEKFDVAFTCLVYAVVDNTFHLISLWLVVKFLCKE
jgi:hypothetical protein